MAVNGSNIFKQSNIMCNHQLMAELCQSCEPPLPICFQVESCTQSVLAVVTVFGWLVLWSETTVRHEMKSHHTGMSIGEKITLCGEEIVVNVDHRQADNHSPLLRLTG